MHKCNICDKIFSSAKHLGNHKKTHKIRFKCNHCSKVYNTKFSCLRHIQKHHENGAPSTSSRSSDKRSAERPSDKRSANRHAMNRMVESHKLRPPPGESTDLILCFRGARAYIKGILRRSLRMHRSVKWSVLVKIHMEKESEDGSIRTHQAYFRVPMRILLRVDEMSHQLNDNLQKIFNLLDEYNNRGSGWRIRNIEHVQVMTAAYVPLQGSSYIPTPKPLASRKGIINVKNKDNKCFKWAILSALHPAVAHKEKVSTYKKFERELNFDSIQFPVKLSQLPKFEKNNNLSICIFSYEKGELFPKYISKREGRRIDLLLLQRHKKSHYCWIKNMSRVFRKSTHKHFFCRYCMHGFLKESSLAVHTLYCSQNEPQKIRMPEAGSVITFENFQNQYKVPFVIYCDMECFCVPNENDPARSIEYVPCSFGYQVVCSDPTHSKPPVIYRGPNVVEKFIHSLFEEEEYIDGLMTISQPLHMTEEDERQFEEASACHICGEQFDKQGKVRDHDHLTSKYRGAAHLSCNLNFKAPPFIPVIFHNLKGFDGKLICQAIGKFKGEKLTCIASSLENYISFSLGKFRFIDSYQFLSCSLEELVANLAKEGDEHFRYLKRVFPHKWQTDLLLSKGIFPYEHLQSEANFEETQLPPKSAFYSRLKDKDISEKEYAHAQQVWKSFGLENLGDYHDVYLLSDVLQLTCVFERFREVSLADTQLDPAHHFTTPHLSWQRMLKMTRVELELLSDPDMYLLFEQMIRGGVSASFQRYSRANNRYMGDLYDPTQPEKYILYLDQNNLYGYSMSMSLPIGEFKWLEANQINQLNILDIPADGPLGYIFQVDLHYPQHLHDWHRNYPLMPEHRTIKYEDLSPYSKRMWDNCHPEATLKQKNGFRVKKLMLTLHDKQRYVTHYRCLQFYLKHGIQIKKIHRVLEFVQQPWLEPYISFNTEKRKCAKNLFESDFYKLMNNSCFGKFMENLRKRCNVQLVHSLEKLAKLIAKPSMQKIRIFTEDLVGVELAKISLILNRPIYVGATILELAKLSMYEFHYDYMKPKYGDNLEVLYTDTDR